VGISAWAISNLKRIPFVYDVQDLWPESALASGLMRPGRLVTALYRLADWVYSKADRILVPSRSAAAYLASRGVEPDKIVLAHNWVDTTAFETPSVRDVRAEFGWSQKFVVMFAGNLGMVQGLETVVEAAALSTRDDVCFVLVGDGADRERLARLCAERKVTNLVFAGQHPSSAMPAFFAAADALLVHLRPSEIAGHAIPTKILAYLASGRPIICATGGAATEVVNEADAGVTLPPGDAAALAAAVERLAAMPPAERQRLGANGRRYLHAHFAKADVIDSYEQVLAAVVRERAASLASGAQG
jgi:glycosyltransferase involved in cell wall biosynthesis